MSGGARRRPASTSATSKSRRNWSTRRCASRDTAQGGGLNMAAEIMVPTLGESVTEATVAKWLKAPGDAVAVDEPVVELETDKVTLEINATVAGTLAEIVAPEGSNVGVGPLLGRFGDGASGANPHT